ncbi:uncharacterized protein B0I36DRAFT_77704 [Microdochium trichocladiopsis]|uniref:Uncharacterized protein n=1 Tax=Microdochium trichocladiopsis TaxID=1682393 RepID=A0A9P9BSV4_9PEZI|nr:uncharacterized protein B0I36DRAFT_77704 [Microdochium trichocladiopsis]KAH7038275.1 hypothetical protein B0I36DRAFT_77704 [Microdochium trichocladiopsis]
MKSLEIVPVHPFGRLVSCLPLCAASVLNSMINQPLHDRGAPAFRRLMQERLRWAWLVWCSLSDWSTWAALIRGSRCTTYATDPAPAEDLEKLDVVLLRCDGPEAAHGMLRNNAVGLNVLVQEDVDDARPAEGHGDLNLAPVRLQPATRQFLKQRAGSSLVGSGCGTEEHVIARGRPACRKHVDPDVARIVLLSTEHAVGAELPPCNGGRMRMTAIFWAEDEVVVRRRGNIADRVLGQRAVSYHQRASKEDLSE